MAETKDYKITFAEEREKFTTEYGEFQSYALKFEGVDGYVQLNQKPDTAPPVVGNVLHGYTYEQNSRKGTFLKFKKVNPDFAGGGSTPSRQNQSMGSSDTVYIIELLEAIAKEVAPGAVRSSEKDTVLEDIDDEPIDLSKIPI